MENMKKARFPLTLAMLGIAAAGCNRNEEKPMADGFHVDSLSREQGMSGFYRYKNADYEFASTYQGGLLEARISKDGQELARISKRDGQPQQVFIRGKQTEITNSAAMVETTTGPLADFAKSVDGQALKLLALESTCLGDSKQLRMQRQGLQMPLMGLQRYGLDVTPPDLEAIASRCEMRCNAPTPNADLLVTCGGVYGRVRPISEVTDKATGTKETYLSGEDCFGACGAGCVGCTVEDYCPSGAGWHVYSCYTRECCQQHDACLEKSPVGYIDPVCNVQGMLNGCTPVTALGLDPGDPQNQPMSFWYGNDDACRPKDPDPDPNSDSDPGWWDPGSNNAPDHEHDGTCTCDGFTIWCDAICIHDGY